MIKINKPERLPESVQQKIERKTREVCEQYDTGQREFDFDGRIYGDEAIKKLLMEAQAEKCCFCEVIIPPASFGDVEHFRPKRGFRQSKGTQLEKPGYYWLAYDWQNLLLCCQKCNQQEKRNDFPLEDDTRRVRSHHEQARLAQETPLLINPAQEDPAEYLAFEGIRAVARNQNLKGRTTIEVLNLNRRDLLEAREKVYKRARVAYRVKILLQQQIEAARANNKSELVVEFEEVLKLLELEIKQAQGDLSAMMRDDQPYAAMVRDASKANFQ